MKKYTAYVRVTVDYEIECEVPDNSDETQIYDLIEPQGLNLIAGDGFDFNLSDLEDEATSRFLVSQEIEVKYPKNK